MLVPKVTIPKYEPESWKIKNKEKRGPGEYEIPRLMTITENFNSETGKIYKKFADAAITPRTTTFGVFSKPHKTKRLSPSPELKAAPGRYFKTLEDETRSYQKLHKPLKKY